jgi:hypothetical protein
MCDEGAFPEGVPQKLSAIASNGGELPSNVESSGRPQSPALIYLLATVVVGIFLGEVVPLLGKIISSVNRRYWADRDAGATVDALHRVDEELVDVFMLAALVFFGVDAVHRTRVNTGRILGSDAGFRDYISHKTDLQLSCVLKLKAIVTA